MRFKNETELNNAVRIVLKAAGLRCIHVREADIPGPFDLIVWKGRFLACWIELKVDDEEVSVSQKEFRRQNPDCTIVMRWDNEKDLFKLWWANSRLEDVPYYMTWGEFVSNWSIELARQADRRQEDL